jgi:2-oxo-4-hydroxy-4-carboxy--5-ureidoimidazoline (OHCU) decarboxylase
MRELPRQLSVEELAELFEGGLDDEEKKEVLDAHPAIGARSLSARSASEQGDDEAPRELDELNRRYEETFGFRFVVFVNRRPKSAIVPILRERLRRTREEELETGVDELVQIAIDRWQRS